MNNFCITLRNILHNKTVLNVKNVSAILRHNSFCSIVERIVCHKYASVCCFGYFQSGQSC